MKKYLPFLLLFIAVFAVYMFTLAPSVTQIDAGELAAAQATLGIAHPTGYPLFTIIGYLFSKIPLPLRVITQLNMLAALWCALGAVMFAVTVKLIMDNLQSFVGKKNKPEEKKSKKSKSKQKEIATVQTEYAPDSKVKLAVSLLSGALLAFSETYWLQSASVEVYSLHIFLIIFALYCLLNAWLKEEFSVKSWLIFAGVLALSFSNHMTTLLILPAAAYLYFIKYGFNKNSFKNIGLMLAVFIPILVLLYAYLPLRASQNPAINWGNPVDYENIKRHISGRQYQVWITFFTESAKKQLGYFSTTLLGEFAYIGFLPILAGVFYSFSKARKLFILGVILFFSTLLYAINYDINDIDSYFLLAYIALGLFASFGFLFLFKKLNSNFLTPVIASSVIILAAATLNFGKADQSGVYVYEDYTKAALNSVEDNAIIFGYQWDFFISPAYYLQHVENYKSGVTVIDKELLRRSWYYNQLDKNHPFLFEKMKGTVSLFQNALKPFEQGKEYDGAALENLYKKIMSELAAKNAGERSFYIAPELFDNEMRNKSFELPEGYELVPHLFYFKVVRSGQYIAAPDPNFVIRMDRRSNYYTNTIANIVCSMLIRRALYENAYNKPERAKMYIDKVRKDFPDYQIAPEVLSTLKMF